MRFVVDLDEVTVVLADAGDAGEASLVVAAPSHASGASEATVHRLGDVLVATNVGVLEQDGSARLRADAVLFHAAGQVDDDWERRFVAACDTGAQGPVLAARATVIWPSAS